MADLTGVPALTLRVPWSHYVAHYGKTVENRTWKPPHNLRTLLIHAGAGNDPVPPHMVPAGDLGDPHHSAIVAIAEVDYVCEASRQSDTVRCGCGDWAMPRQYHWNLTNVVALPEPVPCHGRLRLWYPDADVRAQVERQVAAWAR